MAILCVRQLHKAFGDKTLFSDVSFELMPGDRVGLVGVNGCGKTTLMKMIAGEEPIDGGSVSPAAECRMAVLSQQQNAEGTGTLYEETLKGFSRLIELETKLDDIAAALEREPSDALIMRQDRLREEYERDGGLTFRRRTRAVLMGLGFTDAEMEKSFALFSGGETRKALLAKVLLSGANLLLLDEPTNHLDIRSIEWLEEFLLGYNGAYLVVSHDRYFLDRVTERTVLVENGKATVWKGNYSRHLELKMSAREAAERKYFRQQKEIRRIRGIIEQQKRWNQERNYVTIASKEKQIARIESEMVKPEKDPAALKFQFRSVEPSGNDIIIARDLGKRFAGKQVFRGVDMHVLKGEHICLLGANGCGKTTLLNILLGRAEQDGGSYVIGANVHIGYYEQSMKGLDPSLTVLEQGAELFPRMTNGELRSALGQFLFRGDDVFKMIGDLSGGELARIQLMKLMLEGRNLLLLDEPTNHLDIPSREALENALAAYDGTMLVVTHDRYFVDRIADRILVLDENGLTPFSGDWTEYSSSLRETADAARRQERDKKNEDKPQNDYVNKKRAKSMLNAAKTAAKRAERDVSAAEETLASLQRQMESIAGRNDYAELMRLTEAASEAETALEEAYARWETAENECNSLQQEDTEE